MVLDHLCDTKACVNPEHLAEVTNRHNVLRAPQSPMNVSRRATECRNGHTYPSNPPRNGLGQRICTECAANRSR
jgi:hypothetical protein